MTTSQISTIEVLTFDFTLEDAIAVFGQDVFNQEFVFPSFTPVEALEIVSTIEQITQSVVNEVAELDIDPVLDTISEASSDLLTVFEETLTEGLNGVFINETLAVYSSGYGLSDSLFDDSIEYGNPLMEAMYWRQQQGMASCAVVAQLGVYESLTGQFISEEYGTYFAQQMGWFDPNGGTLPQHVGNLLDAWGIPTYEMEYASIDTLAYHLNVGNKLIVGLDSDEIWNPQYYWDGTAAEQSGGADHAVWVTGIDIEWNGSIGVVLNDSGTPNGQASVIEFSAFMNAWQDSNYFVSIADNPYT